MDVPGKGRGTVKDIDEHTVVHDATSLSMAGVLGLTAAAVTGSPEMALITASAVSAAGIGAMRIGPVRRAVNQGVLAVAQIKRKD
jgi:hypothetical protein